MTFTLYLMNYTDISGICKITWGFCEVTVAIILPAWWRFYQLLWIKTSDPLTCLEASVQKPTFCLHFGVKLMVSPYILTSCVSSIYDFFNILEHATFTYHFLHSFILVLVISRLLSFSLFICIWRTFVCVFCIVLVVCSNCRHDRVRTWLCGNTSRTTRLPCNSRQAWKAQGCSAYPHSHRRSWRLHSTRLWRWILLWFHE